MKPSVPGKNIKRDKKEDNSAIGKFQCVLQVASTNVLKTSYQWALPIKSAGSNDQRTELMRCCSSSKCSGTTVLCWHHFLEQHHHSYVYGCCAGSVPIDTPPSAETSSSAVLSSDGSGIAFIPFKYHRI